MLDGQRDDRLDPEGHLVDDTEHAVGRAHRRHQFRIARLGDLQQRAVGLHGLHPDAVGGDLAKLPAVRGGEVGGILCAAAGARADREIADLAVDEELQSVAFQFPGGIDVQHAGLHGDLAPRPVDVEDPVEARHVEDGAALGNNAARGRVVRSFCADRSGIARRIRHDPLDVLHTRDRFDRVRVIGNRLLPVADGDRTHRVCPLAEGSSIVER